MPSLCIAQSVWASVCQLAYRSRLESRADGRCVSVQVMKGIGNGSATAGLPSRFPLHHCSHFQKLHTLQTLSATLMHS